MHITIIKSGTLFNLKSTVQLDKLTTFLSLTIIFIVHFCIRYFRVLCLPEPSSTRSKILVHEGIRSVSTSPTSASIFDVRSSCKITEIFFFSMNRIEPVQNSTYGFSATITELLVQIPKGVRESQLREDLFHVFSY